VRRTAPPSVRVAQCEFSGLESPHNPRLKDGPISKTSLNQFYIVRFEFDPHPGSSQFLGCKERRTRTSVGIHHYISRPTSYLGDLYTWVDGGGSLLRAGAGGDGVFLGICAWVDGFVTSPVHPVWCGFGADFPVFGEVFPFGSSSPHGGVRHERGVVQRMFGVVEGNLSVVAGTSP